MTAHDGDAAELARRAYRTLEPLHVIGYFAPEPAERYVAAGITGHRRGYFACRSAAMGPAAAEVVAASFFNFNPHVVAEAIPSVWDATTPTEVIAARYAGIDEAYRRVLGADVLDSAEMVEAAELARDATTVLGAAGRPLYAAHARLDWPEPAHLQLFHAQTLLREHRGDGHVAALVLAGLDGIEALVSYVPLGQGLPESLLRATRGWPDEAWDDAAGRLRERGILAEDGSLTEAGTAMREQIEAQTDAAAAPAYRHLGPERTQRLRDLARPWSKAIIADIFGGAQ